MTDYEKNGLMPISVGQFIMQAFIEPGYLTMEQLAQSIEMDLELLDLILISQHPITLKTACKLGIVLKLSPKMLLTIQMNREIQRELSSSAKTYAALKPIQLSRPKLSQGRREEHD